MLLIDNSNTRTKFALARDGVVSPPFATLPTADLTPALIKGTLQDKEFPHTLITSVVPQKAILLTETIPGPVHLLTYQSPLPFSLKGYPKPETIGPDRLANTAAITAIAGPTQAPAIALDLGTAITFDVLSADLTYLGGTIAPGLSAFQNYLPRKGALLPAITLAEPKTAVATSSEAAMLSGTIFGFRGLVRQILDQILAEIPGFPSGLPASNIFVTGGDAPWALPVLPDGVTHDPLLTLKGLHRLAGSVFPPT